MMCYKIKRLFILKVIPFLVFLFFLCSSKLKRLKLDPNQKNTKYVLGKRISAQYSFAHFKPNQFFLALILCLLDLALPINLMRLSRTTYYLQVGILTKQTLSFRNKAKCRLLLC
jgi:hypothetical protein